MYAPPVPNRARNTRSVGFTLIELLVVIAIIAILIAIIFPVFASVLENQRQATTMSNMKQISTALAQFKLDNHKSPDVLFGYAYPGKDMKSALAAAQTAGTASQYFPGLYPTYIKQGAEDVFQDQNNQDTNKFSLTKTATVGVLCPSADPVCSAGSPPPASGTRAAKTQTFYVSDAVDISPRVTGTNTIANPAVYVARYQSSWTDISPTAASANGANYLRQMRWQNPPANTYVTCVTYHVPRADKVLVLQEDGNVRKVTGADFAVHDGTSNPDFWTITP